MTESRAFSRSLRRNPEMSVERTGVRGSEEDANEEEGTAEATAKDWSLRKG